jgi:hypothetical protein
MTVAVGALIERHRSRGILLDSNILLLLFVGCYDRSQITKFKRTRQYTEDDFVFLNQFLPYFSRIVTTPHILTETSNLSGQFTGKSKDDYFAAFARQIEILDERQIPSKEIANKPHFRRFGLTDSVIVQLAQAKILVLSDDLCLCGFLEQSGVDVINFNHIRYFR